jgi:hypothetical protein
VKPRLRGEEHASSVAFHHVPGIHCGDIATLHLWDEYKLLVRLVALATVDGFACLPVTTDTHGGEGEEEHEEGKETGIEIAGPEGIDHIEGDEELEEKCEVHP